jgi:hypothetical protein
MVGVWNWNATVEETREPLPCDGYVIRPYRSMHRAVDVEAPLSTSFRWLCQLTVAPYSYDWIDQRGRRSPDRLTPGADQVQVGQNFLIAPIRDWERDRHISGSVTPAVARVFGPTAFTYRVSSRGVDGSRILVRLNVGVTGVWSRVRAELFAVGDLVMMRKQLLTLKSYAERDAAHEVR